MGCVALPYNVVVKHSYWVVSPNSASRREDSDGPLPESKIKELLGGQYETLPWSISNFELFIRFNPQSKEMQNVILESVCGIFIVGAKHNGKFDGLTLNEATAVFERTSGQAITTSDFWTPSAENHQEDALLEEGMVPHMAQDRDSNPYGSNGHDQ
jgi:hypothetical protein